MTEEIRDAILDIAHVMNRMSGTLETIESHLGGLNEFGVDAIQQMETTVRSLRDIDTTLMGKDKK